MSKVKSTVILNGITLPFTEWEITSPSTGSVGSASITTTYPMLDQVGIDLASLDEQDDFVRCDIFDDGNGRGIKVFGGYYDRTHESLSRGEAQISVKDWSSLLLEHKMILADPNLVNLTPSAIAQRIANSFPFIKGSQIDPSPSGVLAGTIANGEANLSVSPQPVWAVLNMLAQNIGFEVKMTPDAVLIFRAPLNLAPRIFTFRSPNIPQVNIPDAQLVPIRNVELDHSPRRNKTFSVEVISYRHVPPELTRGQALCVGKDLTTTSAKKIGNLIIGKAVKGVLPAGIYPGASGIAQGLQQEFANKPAYRFFISGLTQAQAQARAVAIAKDISKREIVLEGEIDGDDSVFSQTAFRLADGTTNACRGYAGRDFSCGTVVHRYNLSAGYVTHISGLSVPPGAVENIAGGGFDFQVGIGIGVGGGGGPTPTI